MVAVLAAVAIACACWFALPRPSHLRLREVAASPRKAKATHAQVPDLAAIALGIGIAVLLASLWGVVLGLLAAVVVRRLTGRLESRAARDRRIALEQQLAEVCDLLAATLASGAAVPDAIAAVGRACASPANEELARVLAALRLGAAAAQAWQDAQVAPEFARLQRAFERSAVSGAPLADVLTAVARDERRRRRAAVEVAARSAGVRAVGPLAACFLPAFILLGVVPVVASMAVQVFAS